MDFTRADVKDFIKEFLKRIENHRNYEAQAKQVQIKTDAVTKAAKTSNQRATKKTNMRDLSKVKLN